MEIRTYRLRAGSREEFVRVMRAEAVPLLRRHGITVVDSGGSLVDEDGVEEAYLIRAFGSRADREEQEESFYSSDDWHSGPREAILSRIESYHTVVLEVSEEAVRALQR
jgi:hypothetical protein